MIIIAKQITNEAGLSLAYHRSKELSITPGPVLRVIFESWVDSSRWQNGDPPQGRMAINVPLSELLSGQDLIPEVTNRLITTGMFAGGSTLQEGELDLEQLREAKKKEVNSWRWLANSQGFEFAGKQIAYDDVSRWDMTSVSEEVALTGQLPVGFPGAWKAIDNTYVMIPDVTTWENFVKARVSQGAANFSRSQSLKAYIDDASRTVEEIQAVVWNMQL